MKLKCNSLHRPVRFVAVIAFTLAAIPAQAANYYWDGTDTTANADGGSGTWNTTNTNWDDAATGGADVAWGTSGNTHVANFGGTGGTVTLGSSIGTAGPYPQGIRVNAGNYIFDLDELNLSFRASNFVVSSGATAVINNGTVDISLGGSFSVTGGNALTINAKVTGADTKFFKTGVGDLTITNAANDFTGAFYAQNGQTLSFSSIADSGVASAAGAGSIVEIANNGSMSYTGGAASTNRTLSLLATSNGTFKNDGTGALIWTGAFANAKTAAGTLNLGGTNTGANEFQGAISNSTNGGHALSVTKQDAGTWILSGANTYSGATTVSGGTLKIDHANALGFGGIQTNATGTTTVSSGFTLDLNGTTGVNEPIILSGTGIGGNGALVNNSGNAASITNDIAGLAIGAATTGSGYSSAPTVTISGTGSGATATATLGLTDTSATVNASGNKSYTRAPTLTITGGGGTGATATAILSSGSSGTVIGYTITHAGAGYTTAPTVTVSTLASSVAGAGGTYTGTTNTTFTGNAANFTVAGVTLTGTGSGYTGTPTYTFGSGNATPGTVTFSSVTLAANSSIGGSGDITINAVVSESGGARTLTKVGANTLVLSGANTYTGTTTINAGTLQANTADVAATSGALGNGGDITFSGGTLRYTANSAGTDYSARIKSSTSAAITIDTNGQDVTFGSLLATTNTAGLTKEGAGQLDLQMGTTYTGTTTINGGILKLTNTIDVGGFSSSSININNGASLVIFSDVGATANTNRTIFNNGKTLTFGSTGGGSIVYEGGNHLWQNSTGKFVTTGGTQNTISGLNGATINPQGTYTVNFEVADGSDAVDLLVSVQITSGNITKDGAGTMSITTNSGIGGANTLQPNLTINAGTFDVGGTARLNTSGQPVGTVTSDILNNGVYRHSSSGAQTLSGVMSGTGALTQNGSGTLTLSGENTYTGQTTISTGTLQIGAGSTTGKLSASSAIVNNSNLTINRSDAVTQGTDFSSAAITGTGSFTAAGTGTTTLNAANSYSGGTTVNAGADLRINGAQTGVGAVDVAATGKLGGSGSVIGGINVSGILAPGNSIESLGGGALSFATGSTYAYELNTLDLNGDLTYSSGTLAVATGTILTLTDLSTSTALVMGSKLTLISSVGAWDGGLFSYDAGAGLTTLADDSDITLGANIWRFDYNDIAGGSNFTSDTTGATNFVTMTIIPEPNAAMLVGSLGMLVLLRRRR